MSSPSGKQASYSVGYSKPPAHSRFAKGRSGNPKGRPKKAKPPPAATPTNLAGLRASEILLDEAYRPVMIREGDKVIELPAIQAVFRAMGVSAMKGDRHAQRMVAELVQQVESAHRQARDDYVRIMVQYQLAAEQKIADARKAGRPEPIFIPHPDNIIVDEAAGRVFVWGPKTKEQKKTFDGVLGYRDELQGNVSRWARAWQRARNPERKAYFLKEWHSEQKDFDQFNDNLPPRYQVELVDRSWQEGASRPGSQKTLFWPGERKTKQRVRRKP